MTEVQFVSKYGLCPHVLRAVAATAQPLAAAEDLAVEVMTRFAASRPNGECLHRLRSRPDVVEFCRYSRGQTALAEEVLTEYRDVNWADMADCLRAGMTLREAGSWLRRGEDMTAVRVMVALDAPTGGGQRADG